MISLKKSAVWSRCLQEYRQSSLFTKMLLFFTLLAMICTLVVGYATYICAARILLNEVGDANFRLLKQAQEAIDKEIAVIKKVALQVATDQRVNKALYNGLSISPNDIQLSQEIITYLNATKTAINDSSSLWIYFAKSRVVLSNEGRFSDQFFFREMCAYPATVHWPKLFTSVSVFHSIGPQTVTKSSSRSSVITFVASLPVFEYSPLGVIVANVNEHHFEQMLKNVSGTSPVLTLVLDATGKVVCSNVGPGYSRDTVALLRKTLEKQYHRLQPTGTINQRINGKEYTVSHIASTVNDWQYVSIIPSRFITRKIRYTGYWTLAVVMICFILSVILAYFLTRKLYHPIDDILSSISDLSGQTMRDGPDPDNDELKFINKMIRYLYSEKENLRNIFAKSLPMLKEKFLTDIVEGKVGETELGDVGRRLDLNFNYEWFQTVVGEIDEYQARKTFLADSVQLQIIQLIDAMITPERLAGQAQGYAIRKGQNQFCLLINFNNAAHEGGVVYDLLTRITAACSHNYGLTLTLGVGNVYHHADGCAISFQEASTALKHKISKGPNSIIHYDEIRNTPGQSFDYPMAVEKQISNLLKAGELHAVLDTFTELIFRNLTGTGIAPEMAENLFNALAGTMVRTIYDLHFTMEEVFGEGFNIYVELGAKRTCAEKQQYLTSLFTTAIAYIKDKRVAHNQKIYERILEYITLNYATDISLDRVAAAVGLSPSYLSWLFKELSGTNFIDFINKFRVDQAKQLLAAGGCSVAEVAQQVGYSNSNTFIKVFKKYEGITPGQFRNAE